MGQAIAASTGHYTHVAVALSIDSGCYLYEALPRQGVVCRPLKEAMRDYPIAQWKQLSVPFDTLRLQRVLARAVGHPYDDYFLPDNGRFYCSELVYEAYFSPDGHRLFEAQPMNFLAADGSMPAYWTHHFDSLGVAIPQGTPGTNPTDLAASPLLRNL